MKEYDVIAIGTGSALSIVTAMIDRYPHLKAAVIDKDEPGGICLTRGCIPSKMLLYPADLVRIIESAGEFGINVSTRKIDFGIVMSRMRKIIRNDIDRIRNGLENTDRIDYYRGVARFIAPYTLKVSDAARSSASSPAGSAVDTAVDTIRGKKIFLSSGSRPKIPAIEGLESIGYLTSDSLLEMTKLPNGIAIIGGGYIAAEYGHFFSAMGADVTIIGRNPRFLPQEEPEISHVAANLLSSKIKIHTNCDVISVSRTITGRKRIRIRNLSSAEEFTVDADEILIAIGREPNSDILMPEAGGIKTDANGWIIVDEYMQTSQPNVWALGDAIGKYMFKHTANYEARIVYENVVLNATPKSKVNFSSNPHAVFTYPEIAAVGMGEAAAVEMLGEDDVLIGFHLFEQTAKGEAMGVKDCFVKVILNRKNGKILGAHIIGPSASILIQEIINVMNTGDGSYVPAVEAMHIHPALSEVVERAFKTLMTQQQYRHLIGHLFGRTPAKAAAVHTLD